MTFELPAIAREAFANPIPGEEMMAERRYAMDSAKSMLNSTSIPICILIQPRER